MVYVRIKMIVCPEKEAEALEILQSVTERTRVKDGCKESSVYQGKREEEDVIVFEEKWRSEEDLYCHLRSEEYGKVLLVMEMASEEPEVRFDTVGGTTGVETIEKARSGK